MNVSVGGKHINLSDDSGSTDSNFLQAATSALPSAQVDKAKGAFKNALVGYGLAVLAPVLLQVVKGIVGG